MAPTRAALLAALALLTLLGLHLKLRLSVEHPRYDPRDETGYFRAESAFQYRYARLAAQGREIPELDLDAQRPEGIRTRRELTSVMERLTGLSWRLGRPLSGPPSRFRFFVLLWVAFVSSLAIPAFFLAARRLSAATGPALAATALYALSWASQGNLIGAYRLETLGLPLLLGTFACLAAALDPEETRARRWAAAAGLLGFAALASWHLNRLLLLLLLGAFVFARLRVPEAAARLRLVWAAFAGAAAAALAFIPSARESLLFASPSAYGHVYGLYWAKLRHLFMKPADPALLAPIQRIEWTGPSNSPDLGFALFCLLPLALALLPRLLKPGQPEKTALGSAVDFLALASAFGALTASRIMPLLAFFGTLAALRLPRERLLAPALSIFLAALAAGELLKSLAPSSRFNPFLRLSAAFASEESRPSLSLEGERELLRWLRAEARGRPVLAHIGLSASVLTYAGAPIVLQPKFEAAGIRKKTVDFIAALYGTEGEFAAFCEKNEAKLFVYSIDYMLDETPEGSRYASGRLAPRADSAAAAFHMKPQSLKRFRLVFENPEYRVFALGGDPIKPAGLAIYDPKELKLREKPDGTIWIDALGTLERIKKSRLRLLLARLLSRTGRLKEALDAYESSFSLWPPEKALLDERDRLRRSLAR